MFSPIHSCSYCADEYEPIEGNSPSLDPEEVRFCSDDCRERYYDEIDAEEAYRQARNSGAPVFE